MNCKHIIPLLDDYLSEELDLRDRQIVQSHLLKCPRCQSELTELADLQQRIRIGLYLQVAHAVPSPQVWAKLLEQLQSETRRKSARLKSIPEWLQKELPGWLSHPPALLLAAGLVTLFLLIPSIFLHRSPERLARTLPAAAGQGVLALVPTYLPDSDMKETIETEESSTLIRSYHQDDQFITILQQPVPTGTPYPIGKDVAVKGYLASLETSHAERIAYDLPVQRPRRTIQLTWNTGSYQVQVLSNLPVDEVMKVAESLRPARQ